MSNLNDIKNRNLQLVRDRASDARSKIEECYEVQQKEIEDILEKMFHGQDGYETNIENMRHILNIFFYNRPSKSVLLFLKQIHKKPIYPLSMAMTDYILFLMEEKKVKKKPTPRQFLNFVRTSEIQYHQMMMNNKTEDFGL